MTAARIRFCLVFAFAALLLLPAWTHAQSGDAPRDANAPGANDTLPNRLAHVAYMKVDPAEVTSYLSLEREVWMPIHQAMYDDGEILSWALYEVRYPGGTGHDYNYVTVTVVSDASKLDPETVEPYVQRAHPDRDATTMMNRTFAAREMVRTELWYQNDAVFPEQPPETTPPVLRLDFMKVPPEGTTAYLNLEQSTFKPVHQARLDEGMIGSWGLWSKILPGGTDQEHNFGTTTTFRTLSDMPRSYPPNVWETVHPDRDVDDIMAETQEARNLVQTEIWMLLDAVPGAAPIATR